jgi:hypothetical protein
VFVQFYLIASLVYSSSTQEERTRALSKLGVAKQELSMLEKELAAYGACNPTKVEEKKRGGVLAHEAAIRWTGEILHIYIAV